MIINKQDKLSFFQELYSEALSSHEDIAEKLEKYYKQYKGEPISKDQESERQVRNLTYELIESQISSYIPKASVTPEIYSEVTDTNAKAIERLLARVKNKLPYERYNDKDERYTYVYGGSIWLIEWDDTITTHNTSGEVRVTVLSPRHFIGQPLIYDIDDMEYCFIRYDTTVDELVRRYDADREVLETQQGEEATAEVVICYYKDEQDKICEYAFCGDIELSDIEDYYSRKKYICTNCNKSKALCECDKPSYELENSEYEELDEPIITSHGEVFYPMSPKLKNGQYEYDMVDTDLNGIKLTAPSPEPKMERTRLPYYTPSKFPIVVRINTSQEDSLLGQSDCDFIRDQQHASNEIETRIMKQRMRSGVLLTAPANSKDSVRLGLNEEIIYVKDPADKNSYGNIDLTINSQQDFMQADRLYDQAKRVLGINDSFQGQQDTTATSGVAKQIQVQQAQGRLDSKRQMKNSAYADVDERIFQMYLAYADEPRYITYRDEFGVLQNASFNRYDFIERDDNGKYYYNDSYLFAVDPSGDIASQRSLIWQENRLNFQQGAYGHPQMPETMLIFWQNMERAHYPHAGDNVARIKAQIEKMAQMQAQQIGQVPEVPQAPQEQIGDMRNE